MAKRKYDTTENDVIKSSYDSLLNPSEDDEDDFFERFDRLHGAADSQILAKEIEDELEKTAAFENFTAALERLSGEDKDVFERTQMIHFDREEPFETQLFHAINLQKRKEAQRNYVLKVTLMLMVIGSLISAIGLLANKMLSNVPVSTSENNVSYAVKADVQPVGIDEVFKDEAFNAYIRNDFDKDGDGMLSADERNSALIISVAGNTSVSSVEGIELFPMLQALNISYTSVTEVDVKDNVLLENINIKGCEITALDLNQNTKISVIDVSDTDIEVLKLPDVSKVSMLISDHTPISCSIGNEGYYTACHLN